MFPLYDSAAAPTPTSSLTTIVEEKTCRATDAGADADATDAGVRSSLRCREPALLKAAPPAGSAHTTPVFLFAVSSCFSCSLCVLLFLSICACLFVGPASGSLRNGTLGKIK